MNKPELLLPAGNTEKMNYALHYGADAVYLGTADYSLRNTKHGDVFTTSNIADAINTVHQKNKKVYVTINIFARNQDVENLPPFIEYLGELKPDGVIFSDIGVGALLKKHAPNLSLHLSTQANTTNYATVQAWQDFGVDRIILARELALDEIAQIKQKVPSMELEVFVHGSICIAYSGRCILSDYMTENKRRSNQGNCAQNCRWKYYLMEENRPGEYYNIMEDERCTYIMNARDLCLIGHLRELMEIGIDSFKVEGRTKSNYYASIVARAYRKAIDTIANNESFEASQYINELLTAGNRGFTTNFLLGKPVNTDYNFETSKGSAGRTFLAVPISDTIENGQILIRAKNQIKSAAEVEWITKDQTIPCKIDFIVTAEGLQTEVLNTNEEAYINAPAELTDLNYAILRSQS